MATVNALVGSAGVPFKDTVSKLFVLSREVDFQSLDVASGDVVQVFEVPADTWVLKVGIKVVTASDAATSATLNVGDGADNDRYLSGADLKSTAGTVLLPSTEAAAVSGHIYTSADTIDVIPTYSGTISQKGKIEIYAVCAVV